MATNPVISIVSGVFYHRLVMFRRESRKEGYISDLIKNGKNKQDNDKSVMTINGKDITKNEYLIAVEVQKNNIQKMKDAKVKVANAPDTVNKNKFLKQIDKKLKIK